MTRSQKKLWIGLIILALLSPLGIIVPEKFRAGEAWGEWSTETLNNLLGYIPEGLKRYSTLWKAPVPDYNLGGENATMGMQILSYVISGLIGMLVVGLTVYGIGRLLAKHEN